MVKSEIGWILENNDVVIVFNNKFEKVRIGNFILENEIDIPIVAKLISSNRIAGKGLFGGFFCVESHSAVKFHNGDFIGGTLLKKKNGIFGFHFELYYFEINKEIVKIPIKDSTDGEITRYCTDNHYFKLLDNALIDAEKKGQADHERP